MPKIIYMVHSTTIDNEKDLVSGHYDCDLSSVGIEQAQTLKYHVQNLVYEKIICSPLKRASMTANILFPSQRITYDTRLMEIDYGTFTHKTKQFISESRLMYMTTPFPQGESYKDVEKRMQSFLKDHQTYHSFLIIAHQATQLALEVLCHKKTWEDAFKEDWRLKRGGWKPYWIYEY